ncbi:type VII secretion protein EccCa [Actinoplanes couchii]|uniref:Type VII secretion protein EccC n=1 Tax=Actinoplanes couchii TaxID=403638 RepID=A0ABQ3XAP8_9ACTN|nr:type VII secretion protein EccCa [Actinoplanes couchii]MDR6324784.1 S-DNA-T family DNA segregation ATPase FtsK/SpoIIIE [Actinoplanes couchii]GID55592.1 type VII secretion protein EccC [Actinoplanes couchii]
MGTVVVKRAARRPAPEIPAEQLVVEPPPEIPEAVSARWQQWLMALPMLGGTLAMAMMMGSNRGGAYSYVIGGLFGVSSLAMMMTSFGAQGAPRKAEMMSARREYLRHLASLRKRVRETARMQRVGLLYRHPDPERLWSTVGSHRVWERRAGDPDFGVVRVGVGPQTLATPLVPPVTRPLDELEPMTAGALRRFLDAYSVVPDLPVAMSLRGFSRIYVRGDAPGAEGPRALVRAVLTQLAVFHAPDDLVIAVCAGQGARSHWEWVKWLPHAGHPGRNDALGPVRLVAGAEPELAEMLEDVLGNRPRFHPGESAGSTPHVLVVIDGAEPATTRLDDALDGLTVLDLDTAPPRLLDRSALVLEVRTDGVLGTWTMDHESEVGRADGLTVAGAEAVARRLAPLRLAVAADPGGSSTATETGLPELIGLADAESFSVANGWPARAPRDMLRVPIGVSADGMPIELDIKESAQDGMGPHGLLIGATGSGKSELLKTLVLALAATHSSEVLNFILIDFKGGAAFSAMDRLPHTAAVVTNLEHALPLVDRMFDALEGEMARRQEVLSKAGNYASLYDYERARAGGAPLAPLPTLFIVCDEFTEMLQKKQDFIEIFLQIGRLGRSLGVHLLLASQRLEDGRLRGLDTHLSYRIGLRTFSALESRAVLGVPDAYELPKAPGNGYLKFGMEPLVRFKAAYVSGSVRTRGPSGARVQQHGPRVLPWSTQHVAVLETAVVEPKPAAKQDDGPKLADMMVDRIVGQGPPAHQVWLPPLEESSTLDELLGPVGVMPGRGLTFTNPSVHNRLQVPIAIVDKPREQLRDVMWLQLAGAAGHVAVVGGTLSGKSTALRTLICGLALTHTPAEVQIYCMDFGGGSLGTLRDLPHVGGVFSRLDTEGIRRTAGEMITLLAEREARFAELGVDSMASYRSRRPANDSFGDVFLVIDGWSTIRKEFDELEPVLTDLATRGLSYGIHLVAASSRWMDFRSGVRDLFGSRLELRLGDPTDSVINHRAAKDVPEDTPGRGMIVHPTNRAKGLHLLTVRPEVGSLGDTAGLVKAIATAWEGKPAPRVRLLPPSVPYSALHAERGSGLRIPIGIAEANLQPVEIDFAGDPHFLLFGDAEAGKSSFLRSMVTTLTNRFQPEECRIILVDYRRSLIDIPPTEHRIGYGMQAEPTLQLIQSAAAYMERRLPGPDVTARQLRDRSWWTGPELFVLVDDYDLVVSGPTNPLTPLVNYLAQARDIGLHLVLTRRSGGASRSLYEPVIQKLRELSMPGLVMSGSPEEGALIGNVKPMPMPPGRGRLITRREGTRLIQLAHQPPFQDSGK